MGGVCVVDGGDCVVVADGLWLVRSGFFFFFALWTAGSGGGGGGGVGGGCACG